MAYEYFKRIKKKDNNVEQRYPFKIDSRKIIIMKEGFLGKILSMIMKNRIESACVGK